MRFCGACGKPLPPRCGACGTFATLPDQRFCGNCGSPLLSSGPARERRLISVMFCDLVGFTTFSESRDYEDVRDVLEQYFSAARRVVAAYGGTIEKFIGDAVMAVWGAPVAQEDDAERAVRAGLDIAAAVAALSDRLQLPELALRVGILTGEAAVDTGGTLEGMVIGDSVNTASRIQGLADAGTVFVDEVTRLATERAVAYEDAGTHIVKGRANPVRVWRALHVVSLRHGAGRPHSLEPPLVGREGELARLKAELDDLLARATGGPRIVGVMGEAGLGKTRLAWELQKYADGRAGHVRWLAGRTAGFGEGIAFSALSEMIRSAAGISLDDGAERQRRLLDAWLDELLGGGDPERLRLERALYRLLELDDAQETIEPGGLFSAWREVLERQAAQIPIVLCFEELQRADQALLDFIAHLLEWAEEAPILMLALSRPDARLDPLAPPGERIELTPMSDDRMDALVAGIVDDPPELLLSSIRADGGGVPLFAVETLRALADAGVLGLEGNRYVFHGTLSQLAIPPTIRALIASRLDRLGQLERRVLAAGAILGEWFTAAGAANLAGVDEIDARALLDGLIAKAILTGETAPGSPLRGRYGFLQGVVRRVVLSTLARRERRRLHLAAVAHLLDATEPELAAQLAGHLLAAVEAEPRAPDAADLLGRAGTTLREAAERAAAVGSLEEAISLLDRAAELAEDEGEQAIILERAGAVGQRAGLTEAAAEHYRRAGELHAQAGRERARQAARAHELRARRYERAAAEMLPELRELDASLAGQADAPSALAASVLAFTLYQCGRHEEALAVAQRATETAEACHASTELVMSLGAQASALGELQRPEEAIEIFHRTLALVGGREERLVATLAGNLAITLGSVSRYEESVARGHEAVAAARRAADRFFERHARLVLGRSLCSLGQWDEAEHEIEAVMADVSSFHMGMVSAPLVVIALARGEEERVVELIREYDRRCGETQDSAFATDFRALRAASLAIVAGDRAALARILPEAEVGDYAEWTGWVAPVVDGLLAAGDQAGAARALAALRGPGRVKRTATVQVQAERLTAHLAAWGGDSEGAAGAWQRAGALAERTGMRFEAAVLALERSEHGGSDEGASLQAAAATFEHLRARPWLDRARERLARSAV